MPSANYLTTLTYFRPITLLPYYLIPLPHRHLPYHLTYLYSSPSAAFLPYHANRHGTKHLFFHTTILSLLSLLFHVFPTANISRSLSLTIFSPWPWSASLVGTPFPFPFPFPLHPWTTHPLPLSSRFTEPWPPITFATCGSSLAQQDVARVPLLNMSPRSCPYHTSKETM